MEPMDFDNKANQWRWKKGNQGFHFKIPLSEHTPLPSSTIVQGRYENWTLVHQARTWVLDLHNRTLKEVEREVAQIAKGDHFTSLGINLIVVLHCGVS